MDGKKIKKYVGIIAVCFLLAVLMPPSVLSEATTASEGAIRAGSFAGIAKVPRVGAGTIGVSDAITAAAAAAVAASQSDSSGI